MRSAVAVVEVAVDVPGGVDVVVVVEAASLKDSLVVVKITRVVNPESQLNIRIFRQASGQGVITTENSDDQHTFVVNLQRVHGRMCTLQDLQHNDGPTSSATLHLFMTHYIIQDETYRKYTQFVQMKFMKKSLVQVHSEPSTVNSILK